MGLGVAINAVVKLRVQVKISEVSEIVNGGPRIGIDVLLEAMIGVQMNLELRM